MKHDLISFGHFRLDFIKLVSQAYYIPQKVLVSGITQT